MEAKNINNFQTANKSLGQLSNENAVSKESQLESSVKSELAVDELASTAKGFGESKDVKVDAVEINMLESNSEVAESVKKEISGSDKQNDLENSDEDIVAQFDNIGDKIIEDAKHVMSEEEEKTLFKWLTNREKFNDAYVKEFLSSDQIDMLLDWCRFKTFEQIFSELQAAYIKHQSTQAITLEEAQTLVNYLKGKEIFYGVKIPSVLDVNEIKKIMEHVKYSLHHKDGMDYDRLVGLIKISIQNGKIDEVYTIPDSRYNASTGKPTDIKSYISEDFEQNGLSLGAVTSAYKTVSEGTQRFINRIGLTVAKHRGRRVYCGDFIYLLTGRYLTVLKYRGDAETVEVPAYVGGVPVKVLHPDFLVNNMMPVDSYNIRGTFKTITGKSARLYSGSGKSRICSQLILPNTLKVIPIGTFAHCKNLKSLVIPASVTSFDVVGTEKSNIRLIYFEGEIPHNFRRDRFSGKVYQKVEG